MGILPQRLRRRVTLAVPEQKATFTLRQCGKLLECRELWNWNQSERQKRGECKEPFSRQSRLRLLREIAQIEWHDKYRYSLITLTYPDERLRRSPERQTIDRSRFVRELERMAGRHMAILWRKEWEDRKSGEHKGTLQCHWHFLAFNAPWVDKWEVRQCWAKIIDYAGPLATDIREAKNGEHAAHYAAKYCGKISSCSLDNVSYLNSRFGRAWGFCRKHMVPYYQEHIIPDLSRDELALARHLAHGAWQGIEPGRQEGFTLFGPDGAAIMGSVMKMRLARSRRKC